MPDEGIRIGLVLAGGAARGAYEVGVLEHVVTEVAKDLGFDITFDILCGTSVGAINVACLAAFADEPRSRVARLDNVWSSLRVTDILRPLRGGWIETVRGLLGRGSEPMSAVFQSLPVERLLSESIPFERIGTHLREGRLHGVTVSATQVSSGRTVVFVQRKQASPSPWPETPAVLPKAVRLRPAHILASAAVPMLFPSVRIDGRHYCDGGLRQNIPLSPARRLGATHILVVNPKHQDRREASHGETGTRETGAPSPLFLLGKTFNALLLDRIDNDLDRLEKINAIIAAGERRYGSDFAASISEELGYPPTRGLRNLETVHISASENITHLCAEYVRRPEFSVPGMLGRLMKRLAEDTDRRESDLLTFVLFDGGFARRLIELGRHDARAHHEALCHLFAARGPG
ncbi:MAG: patatin-like phospholipase family protein [Myxococcota bacterium]